MSEEPKLIIREITFK